MHWPPTTKGLIHEVPEGLGRPEEWKPGSGSSYKYRVGPMYLPRSTTGTAIRRGRAYPGFGEQPNSQ